MRDAFDRQDPAKRRGDSDDLKEPDDARIVSNDAANTPCHVSSGEDRLLFFGAAAPPRVHSGRRRRYSVGPLAVACSTAVMPPSCARYIEMARAKMPALQLRGGIWWIWKQIDGYGRIRQSTGYGKNEYERAEHFLIKRLNEIRDAQRFGIRPARVFREAAAKFLMEHTHLSTIGDIAITFKQVDRWIGHLPLKSVHDGTLAPLVADWRTRRLSNRTINIVLCRGRRVLRLAAMKWRDENNLTWLETPPLLTTLNVAFGDCQVLLGHRPRTVTQRYMAAEIVHLIEAAERVLETEHRTTVPLTIIRRKAAKNQARRKEVAQKRHITKSLVTRAFRIA